MIMTDSIYVFGASLDTVATDTALTTAVVSDGGTDDGFAFCLDSIFKLPDIVSIQRPSIFAGHQLPVQNDMLMARPMGGDDMWFFGIIMSVLVLITVCLRINRFKLGTLFQSGVIQRKMDMLMREALFTRFTTFLQGLAYFSLMVSMVAFYLIRKNGLSNQLSVQGGSLYALMVATVAGACLLRQGVTWLLGNVFDNKDAAKLYLGNTQIYLFIDTIVLLPLSLLLFFSPLGNNVIPVILVLMSILMIIRLIRGMQIILSVAKNSKFYLFYYLCTVEIIPFLIIAKLALG